MTLEEICSSVRSFIAAPDVKPSAFENLALEVFAFQFERNAPHRAFCNSRGVTPATLTQAAHIPAVVTTAFKDLELSVLPGPQRTTVFHSSGTTEHRPSRHFHSAATLQVYNDSLLRWFKPHVMPDLAKANFLILTPRSSEAPHSSLVHMFETLAARFATNAQFTAHSTEAGWDLDLENFLSARESLCASELPVVICGTAFSFVHLCDALHARGLKLDFPPGSRVFETGGYKGRSRAVSKEDLHHLITDRLSIPSTHIVSEYGMSELSSQAYDRVIGNTTERIFRFPHWARATIISPESGEEVPVGQTGLLRIVDLANVGSVMAIQTADLAVRREAGFQLLGRASEAEARGCSLMQVGE